MKGKDYLLKYQFSDCGRSKRYISATKMALTNKFKKADELFKEWNVLMIVRNPIDRLISGFMQLCYYRTWLKKNEDYCYHCNKNITCFVDRLYNELVNVANKEKIPNQFNDYHFYPQTWQCEYYKYKKNYNYLKYPSKDKNIFYGNLMKELKKSGVALEHINFLSNKVKTFNTFHTTTGKKDTKNYKESLFKNTKLIRKICSIFYYDFIEFGFEFPKACEGIPVLVNNTV
uniref:Carbohydrate sulfotransferase n=1 Tax=Strongyloides papillosus TaxID=174720 RepID=A0A0N5BJ07_STREA